MRGYLGNGGLSELLRNLAAEQATGTLTLTVPNGQAWVSLRDGTVEYAVSPGQPARLAERLVEAGYLDADALRRVEMAAGRETLRLAAAVVREHLIPPDVVRMFLQEHLLDAVLHLTLQVDRAGPALGEPGWSLRPQPRTDASAFLPVMPVDDLLDGVARRRQEWERISRLLESLEHVPVVVDSPDTALEPDETAMMAAMNGERSLRGLAQHLGLGEVDAARLVYGLVLLGVVEMRPPATNGGEDIDVGLALEQALSQDFSADFADGLTQQSHDDVPAERTDDALDLDWALREDLQRADPEHEELEPLVWRAVLDEDGAAPATPTAPVETAPVETAPFEPIAPKPAVADLSAGVPTDSQLPAAELFTPDGAADEPAAADPAVLEPTVAVEPPEWRSPPPPAPTEPAEPAVLAVPEPPAASATPSRFADDLLEEDATQELLGLLEERHDEPPEVRREEAPVQRDRGEIYELLRELTWLSEDRVEPPRSPTPSSSAPDEPADRPAAPGPREDKAPPSQPPAKAPRDQPKKRRGRLFGPW